MWKRESSDLHPLTTLLLLFYAGGTYDTVIDPSTLGHSSKTGTNSPQIRRFRDVLHIQRGQIQPLCSSRGEEKYASINKATVFLRPYVSPARLLCKVPHASSDSP